MRTERLAQLGLVIRSTRQRAGLTVAVLAERLAPNASPATLNLTQLEVINLESGGGGYPAFILRVARALGLDQTATDTWFQIAGQLPPDLFALVVGAGERWSEVRALLTEAR